ncbi:unnamed protein product [Peniophora sp. CBMAI 1063]|nr:unnamed protein product [Peniophora sp. CBMAI 1063]
MFYYWALQLTPDGHLRNLEQLDGLGRHLHCLNLQSCQKQQLQCSISVFHIAVECCLLDDPCLPLFLNNLAVSFHSRFERFGDSRDLENALDAERRAVKLTPTDDPNFPRLLSNLAAVLSSRFGRFGESSDLDSALDTHRRAVELTPTDDPELPLRLSNLATSFLSRFERFKDSRDLENALDADRRAVELTPVDDPKLPRSLSNLAVSFHSRFQRFGDPSDLESALDAERRAVELTPNNDLNFPLWLNNLAISLHTRFERFGNSSDLENALDANRRAVELTLEDDPCLPRWLNNLAASFFSRFRRFGDSNDLDRALDTQRRAVDLTPTDNPKFPLQLSNLAVYFHSRFQRFGDSRDLENALDAERRAVKLTPTDDLNFPLWLSNLASFLSSRFGRFGDSSDLDSALDAERRAVELTLEDDPCLPRWLNNLAASFFSRFRRFGDSSDLDRALDTQRRAVDLTPTDNPDLPLQLSSLALSFHYRFERFGDSSDMENALDVSRHAVKLTPTDDPNFPWRLSSLALSFRSRFECFKDSRDLENALDAERRAVELTPADNPGLPWLLSNLATSFQSRFDRFGDSSDLQNALDAERRAVELTPTDDPELPRRLSSLALSFRSRFERFRDRIDLQSALNAHQSAVKLTPDGHPEKLVRIRRFADCCACRFMQQRTQQDFDEADSLYQSAMDQHVANPVARSSCAEAHMQFLTENAQFSDLASLFFAHSRVVDTLPELVWLGHSVERRLKDSARAGVLVNSAVSVAIESRELSQAVVWLEAGRGLIWSQIASIQSPLDDLTERYPDAASEMRKARHRLQQLGTAAQISMRAPITVDRRGPTRNETMDHSHYVLPIETASYRYQKAVITYDSLVKKIRYLDGFQDFMRPRKLADLVASPAFRRLSATAVVFINVAEMSCDALVLSNDGAVKLVHLPELSKAGAEKLQSLWMEHVGIRRGHRRGETSRGDARNIYAYSNIYVRLLSRLWSWVIYPILLALDLITTPSGKPSSHIIWCPTGSLTQLPLHAAGNYDQREPRLRIFDFVISSYTPSLSALLRCLGKDLPATPPSMLLVAQSHNPRLRSAPLPCVRDETACLRAILPGEGHVFLEDVQASVEHTLAAINQHSWVHFACHASQNSEDPTLTAIELHDKPLTLETLMHNVSKSAELAFLSACETAVGDKTIPEESVHLAAGMLAVGFKGVVATMWSIYDQDAPVIVEAYYKKLLELRASRDIPLGHTGAAYALHHATMVLKDKVGEKNFERWVPFVHFGV